LIERVSAKRASSHPRGTQRALDRQRRR